MSAKSMALLVLLRPRFHVSFQLTDIYYFFRAKNRSILIATTFLHHFAFNRWSFNSVLWKLCCQVLAPFYSSLWFQKRQYFEMVVLQSHCLLNLSHFECSVNQFLSLLSLLPQLAFQLVQFLGFWKHLPPCNVHHYALRPHRRPDLLALFPRLFKFVLLHSFDLGMEFLTPWKICVDVGQINFVLLFSDNLELLLFFMLSL